MTTLTPLQGQAVDAAARVGREYLRVSKGKGRTARSIRDQHTDNLDAGEEFGPWEWGEPYKDTGSASKYARKVRDDFEKLLEDLKTGEFGKPGDVLVLWEISRLSRETGRGVEIVDLCEAQGYLIMITSHERPPYNPANYNDRHELISGIADAEREARRLSKRTLRGLNSAAREGRPQGQVPFGYLREYEVIDRRPRPSKQYPHPEEGPLVAELFVRVAGVDDNRLGDDSIPLLYTNPVPDGGQPLPEPMYAIAKEWASRGIVSRDRTLDGQLVPGGPFSPSNLRCMLLRPAYAGLRKHNGQLIPQQWDGYTPVVSRKLFDLVQKVLADPSRRTYTGEHIRHVLSMTMRCGVCRLPMAVMARNNRGGKSHLGYQCHPKGHVWVSKEEVDRIVIGELDRFDPDTGKRLAPVLGMILKYLSDPPAHAALRRRPDSSKEELTVRAELERMNSELTELEKAPTPKTARARIQRTTDIEELETEIEGLEAKLVKLTRPAPLAALLPDEPIKDVVAWWKQTSVEKQRAIAAVLLTPSVLGEVRFMPAPGRRPTPVHDRLALHMEVD